MNRYNSSPPRHHPEVPPVRVLSVTGGSATGLVPSRIVAALEQITDRPAADLFDAMVGTSIGGVLVLGLTAPDNNGRPAHQAEELNQLYLSNRKLVFSPPTQSTGRFRDLSRPTTAAIGRNKAAGNSRYPPDGLETLFSSHLGTARLADAVIPVTVTAYDLQTHSPLLLSSHHAQYHPDSNPLMVQAARATTAAPTWFPPQPLSWDGRNDRLLIDGGIFANNPALIAYAEGVRIAEARRLPNPRIIVVSTGTFQPGRTEPISPEEVATRSWLRLGRDLVDAAVAGQDRIQDHLLDQLIGDDHWNLRVPVSDRAAFRMDDITGENLDSIAATAHDYLQQRQDMIHNLARLLTPPHQGGEHNSDTPPCLPEVALHRDARYGRHR